MRRKCLFAALLLFAALFLFSCERERSYSASVMGAFDTVTVISAHTESKKDFSRLAERFESLLWEYHTLYDIYSDYPGINNLKTVNDMAGIAPVQVEPRIIELLEYALEIDRLTDGACRVTYGAVLKLWHEYRTEGEKRPPLASLIDAAEHTDPSLLVIDREAGTVFLTDPRASLDVGAIAKGYATEKIAQALSEMGYSDFALNVGGNLRTVGKQHGKDEWVLGIRDPGEGGVLIRLAASDAALVTSGVYERYYEVNGEHLHHIIDPSTHAPARGWLSISVLAPDSALADALSTALFTMSAEQGLALIEQLSDVEAIWLDESGCVTYSSGGPSLVREGELP